MGTFKKVLFSGILLGCFICSSNSNASVNTSNESYTSSHIENLSILVPSCDKYAEAWHPFFTLLFKYWPAFDQKIYLIGNQKTYEHKSVVPVLIPQEKSWSDNVLTALNKIPDDYVMIILEDYFLTSTVDVNSIKTLFKEMQNEKSAVLQLAVRTDLKKMHPSLKNVGYLEKDSEYRTSLQIAIWDKAVLKSLLIAGENPWLFEIDGTKRSRSFDSAFMSVVETSPISYFGAIWRGYWTAFAMDFLKKEKIDVQYTLPVCSKFRAWLMGDVRTFLSLHVIQPVKRWLGMNDLRILPVEI